MKTKFPPWVEEIEVSVEENDRSLSSATNEATNAQRAIDPSRWVEEHGNCLYAFAVSQVRNGQIAEDLVQETLLAALRTYQHFAGRSSERTWLIGILKKKIADHFRKAYRERFVKMDELPEAYMNDSFSESGEWPGHWIADKAPQDWNMDPARVFEQTEFWSILRQCLSELPPRLARAFWLREVEGLSSAEVCKDLGITATNLWVMLHRVRTHLRQSLESRWLGKEKKRKLHEHALVG